ncbi:hypothetical protein A1A1_11737 [Planococcus antarcticus DSM 14505]|uniref:Uncharacterized protein n=1 Tax=Planococcus antarcticus DSM 14505 TaxID=1185653 RepID=A0AA87LRH9_9BACL|nr:hypothetical protein A1A1_11737 [Planococcus antarcticus DSM 14505]
MTAKKGCRETSNKPWVSKAYRSLSGPQDVGHAAGATGRRVALLPGLASKPPRSLRSLWGLGRLAGKTWPNAIQPIFCDAA